jgi:glutathione synthase/RimK-type ligase-like ATP-grasp enzyme
MTAPANDSDKRRAYQMALGDIETRLQSVPGNADLLFERARLLTLLGRDDDALQAYLALLRREPTHFGALTNLASLSLATGHLSAALTAYRQAVACHPDNPAGLVNLANLLAEDDDTAQALALYRRALAADPDHPQAHRGLGQILFSSGDVEGAESHWRKGFVGHSIVTRPYRGTGNAIRILVLASPRDGNIPTTLMLDDRVFAITTLFPEYHDPSEPLPPHDLLFNAIGDADLCTEALKAAMSITARSSAPVVNAPEAVLRTGRQNNTKRFADFPGVIAPKIAIFAKAQLLAGGAAEELAAAGFTFPLLLRPPGFQTGLHFERVASADVLSSVAANMPNGNVFVIQYLDSAGSDGVIRKYRVMMIDGVIYPLHMAGSHDWKIHYFSSEMANREDLRREEEMFLNDMPASLGKTAMAALNAIRAELALDYAGIDFGLSRDGQLVFFEANATMIIYPPPDDPIWDYRRGALDRALNAAKKLLVDRAAS